MKFSLKLKIAIGAVIVLLGISCGIGFLPGPAEGIYSAGHIKCLCGGKGFMRLFDGKIIIYNTNHSPAQLAGKYTNKKEGMVELAFIDVDGKVDPSSTLLCRPYRLLLRTPPAEGKPSGWDFRFPEWGYVSRTIREHEIVEQRTESDGSTTKEYFNSQLTALRTEKNAEQADDGVRDEL